MLNAQTQISKEVTYCVDKNGEYIIPVKYLQHEIAILQDALYNTKDLTFAELEYHMHRFDLKGCAIEYNAAYNMVEVISNPNSDFECTAAYFSLLSVPKVKVLPTVAEVKAMSIEAQVELISTMFYEMAEIRRFNLLADKARSICSPTIPSDRDTFVSKYGFNANDKAVSNAVFNLLYNQTPKTKASSIKLPF